MSNKNFEPQKLKFAQPCHFEIQYSLFDILRIKSVFVKLIQVCRIFK